MTFAEQCVFVRTKLLLNQGMLAKELGVSVVTISRWETQDRKPQAIQYGKFLSFCEKKGVKFDSKSGEVL
ncbi:MAG: helix-turn-helix transcriptional regulator [Bacilli bacterium]|nr:helix-turn-helix transcriptional regulator [Bacilli bacterium]